MRGRLEGSEEIFLPAAVTGYCARDPTPLRMSAVFVRMELWAVFPFDILVW